MISSSQRPLPDNTQHSQRTNIHAPGEIRTHDLSRRAAADLRLRPRGHWDRHYIILYYIILYYIILYYIILYYIILYYINHHAVYRRYKKKIILHIDRGGVLHLTKVLAYVSIHVTRRKAISNAKIILYKVKIGVIRSDNFNTNTKRSAFWAGNIGCRGGEQIWSVFAYKRYVVCTSTVTGKWWYWYM